MVNLKFSKYLTPSASALLTQKRQNLKSDSHVIDGKL